jgi:hypothetical protein
MRQYNPDTTRAVPRSCTGASADESGATFEYNSYAYASSNATEAHGITYGPTDMISSSMIESSGLPSTAPSYCYPNSAATYPYGHTAGAMWSPSYGYPYPAPAQMTYAQTPSMSYGYIGMENGPYAMGYNGYSYATAPTIAPIMQSYAEPSYGYPTQLMYSSTQSMGSFADASMIPTCTMYSMLQ